MEKHMLRGCPDKQWVSRTLDEDAKRYFEECVSISGLEGDGQDASNSGKQQIRMRSPSRTPRGSPRSLRHAKTFRETMLTGNGMESDFASPVRSPSELPSCDSQDGLVLPWLDWETEVDGGPQHPRNDSIHKVTTRNLYNFGNLSHSSCLVGSSCGF